MKTLRMIFSILLVLLVFMAIAGFYIGSRYGDEIKSYAIAELNGQLKAKVDVDQVNFSLFENFPFASLQFQEAVIYSTINEQDTLLSANLLTCKFNVLDLYHGNYTLEGLEIEGGFCRMTLHEEGAVNWVIWKSSEDSLGKFQVQLKQIDIRQMDFRYWDKQSNFKTQFFIQKNTTKASISESETNMSIRAKVSQFNLKSNELSLIENKNAKLEAILQIETREKLIHFQEVDLELEALLIALEGNINYREKTDFNLKVNSQNIDLETGLSILPATWKNQLSDYSISGIAGLSGSIIGQFGEDRKPKVDLGFWAKNARFQKANTDLVFQNGSFDGAFSNGALQSLKTASLRLNNIQSELNEGKIKGNLDLINLAEPKYILEAELDFRLSDLIAFSGREFIQNPSGKIKGSFALRGAIADLEQYTLEDFKKSGFNGQFQLEQVGVELLNDSLFFKGLNGELSFMENQVALDGISGKVNENSMQVNGSLYNLIPYLNAEKEELQADLVVRAEQLNINRLLKTSSSQDEAGFSLPQRMHLFVELNVSQLLYKRLELNELNGDFEIKSERLLARNLKFNGFEGDVLADVFVENRGSYFQFQTLAQVNQIQIEPLFQSFDNFGQNIILSNQIKGRYSSDLRISLQFEKSGTVDLKSLKIESDLEIENGALIGIKSLESLSEYIELQELKNIRFKSLKNQLLVQDCTIFIPKFNIQSTALNFSLAGQHQFNNTIDYHIVILLEEVLSKKVKKPKSNEFGYIEDDGLGQTKVFLKMTGTTENPEFSYDKSELKSHLKEEVAKEKKTIKTLLNQEFGLFKKDSSLQNKKQDEKPQSSPFQIDWEEKPTENEQKQGREEEKKADKKGRFGKFIDKIAKPNEEEYENPKDD